MNALTRDAPETNHIVRVQPSGALSLSLPMRTNDIVLVTLERQ
jgi:xylan 1,4-beta-xylosidase